MASQGMVDQDGLNMTSRELNPKFYEASRAGHVIQHYINTVHGSPFRLYGVTQVHKAKTEVRTAAKPNVQPEIRILTCFYTRIGRNNHFLCMWISLTDRTWVNLG